MSWASMGFAQTCDSGFVLEENAGQYNCRNPICDLGDNMYGVAIDSGQIFDPILATDADGMPRPFGKDSNGQWVGWTVGAFQCPPDPIGRHPNPSWPCGYDYCPKDKPQKPINLRIVNLAPKYR